MYHCYASKGSNSSLLRDIFSDSISSFISLSVIESANCLLRIFLVAHQESFHRCLLCFVLQHREAHTSYAFFSLRSHASIPKFLLFSNILPAPKFKYDKFSFYLYRFSHCTFAYYRETWQMKLLPSDFTI